MFQIVFPCFPNLTHHLEVLNPKYAIVILRGKKITGYCVPRGTKKSVPYVTVTIWAMEILKEGFKNNNMAQIHPRLLGHNNY